MKQTICSLLFFITLNVSAQTLHDSIIVDWTHSGFEGSIPEFPTIVDVTSFGAIAGDTIDDQPAVANAISSLNGNAGVVYFPPGNYLLKSTVNLPDSTVLCGAGADSTVLTFNFNNTPGNSINISGGPVGAFTSVSAGCQKGASQIIVPGADSLFSGGDEIEIRLANGAWDTNPATWADYSVGHLSRIDSVSGDSIWLHEPIRMNFDSTLNPEIRKINTRNYCGLECFKMIRVDSTAASINFGVNYTFAKNCWMIGVESEKSICAHVSIETSSHIEISGCYFHHSYIYDGASTHGYGIVVYAHSGSNKIEDNIFRMLRHAMIAKQGANGNVFGYNYSRETNRSEPIADYAADICMHGHYAFANLFEGNIVQNLQVDQAWGPSGPFNTFFRNKVENYGILMSSGNVESDRQNFVGNDASNMAIFHGMYTLAGVGHFEYGNNVQGTIIPSGTNNLSDVTYYLDTIPPVFWNIPASLPSIGIPNAYADDINPALQRYLDGGIFTLCRYEEDTSITTHINIPSGELLQNCFLRNNRIHVEFISGTEQNLSVRFISMTGQEILCFRKNVQVGINKFSEPIPGQLAKGLYFIQVVNPGNSFSKMVLVE